MEKRSKKTLVQSLRDRSGRQKEYSKNNNYDSISISEQRLEKLENEVKIFKTYIGHIENLENNIEKLTKDIQKLSLTLNFKEPSETQQIDNNSNNNYTWSTLTRFTKFFRQRPTIATLKSKNIYQNEPCFDTEIENVIKHERYHTVPKIVVECIEIIESKIKISSIDGLYRTCGNYVEIQRLRFLIDSSNYDCLKTVKDVHTIVGVLKLFFREIKSPLIRPTEVKAFVGGLNERTLKPIKYKIEILQKLVKILPEINRDTLSFFLKHLSRLTRTALQYVNSRSLAISLTPTIFHTTRNNQKDINATMKESEILANSLEIMIEYYDRIFDETMNLLQRSSIQTSF